MLRYLKYEILIKNSLKSIIIINILISTAANKILKMNAFKPKKKQSNEITPQQAGHFDNEMYTFPQAD